MKISVIENIIKTKKEFQIIDITEKVEKFIKNQKVKEGQISISTKHTTTSIVVNENEKRLLKDIEQYLSELAPKSRQYLHDDIEARRADGNACPKNEPKNAHSHLNAILMGSSETLPIKDGKLDIGRWQRIMFIELDGPRKRTYAFELIAN